MQKKKEIIAIATIIVIVLGTVGFLTKDRIIVFFKVKAYGNYHEGLRVVQDRKSKKYGFINRNWEIVIPARYYWAGSFTGEIALVQLNKFWGYIDRSGKYIIEPKFTENQTYEFKHSELILKDGPVLYYITSGNRLIKGTMIGADYKSLTNGWAYMAENGKYGVVDKKGKVIIPAGLNYEQKHNFNLCYVAIKVGERWAQMDTTNKRIEFCLSAKEAFEIGYALVVDGKYAFIDKKGQIVQKPECEELGFFKDGLLNVRIKGKWGSVNRYGEVVIKPEFDEIIHWNESGYRIVKINKKYGFIDKEGKLSPSLFDEINWDEFSGSKPAIVRIGQKYGFVDDTGKVIVKIKYDAAERFMEKISGGDDSNVLGGVKLNGLWGVVDKKGKMVYKPQFEDVDIDTSYSYEQLIVKKNGKWYWIDADGTLTAYEKNEED
jgi:hypothetical protein